MKLPAPKNFTALHYYITSVTLSFFNYYWGERGILCSPMSINNYSDPQLNTTAHAMKHNFIVLKYKCTQQAMIESYCLIQYCISVDLLCRFDLTQVIQLLPSIMPFVLMSNYMFTKEVNYIQHPHPPKKNHTTKRIPVRLLILNYVVRLLRTYNWFI